MRLVDTHVHVNFESFQGDFEQTRDRWRSSDVALLVHSCVVPSEFPRTLDLMRACPELYASVGLHPLESRLWSEQMVQEIETLARAHERVVAIGETGLDLYKDDNLEGQIRALQGQLGIARRLGKPAIVHCRDAAAELRELLVESWREEGPVPGVMHCWGGSPAETEWFLDLGLHISFSGVVTFKSAATVRESARIVPSERLLVETDCPFLAPVPKRGHRNEPAYVRHVAEAVAAVRGVTVAEVARHTTANACALFGLPHPEPVTGTRHSVLADLSSMSSGRGTSDDR